MWEADAELILLFGTDDAGVPAAEKRAKVTHFVLDRARCRREIDVQCTELLRRAEVLGVPTVLPAKHLCFEIRRDGLV